MSAKIERVIVYIDGFNLYFGLKDSGWSKYFWLDLRLLSEKLLLPNQTLVHTKYFTSKVSKPAAKRRRQQAFLSALGTLPDFSIYYGRYQSFDHTCVRCGHVYVQNNEKRTDVNIATHMLIDAFEDEFDTAILVSADSDLTFPVKELVRMFPNKYIKVAFPPNRSSFDLKNAAPTCFPIFESKFRQSVFPSRIRLQSGHEVERPAEWT